MIRLTLRQREALALAANGNTNDQIGRALGVTRTTIDRRLAAAYQNLGARDRAHAVALALLGGDLTPADIQTPDTTRRTA
jgi:DNA-binding CsgD family transcriptional regulator